MRDFASRLAQRVLICDGAMGTMLHTAGNSLDRALPELNLSDPGVVRTVHDGYIDAGVDVVQTNTFGANRLRLTEHGLSGMVRDINTAGVALARQAREEAGRDVFVAGSVSPAVTVHQRRRSSAGERATALREQVEALAAGGVDLVILETFGYLDELVQAVEVAHAACALPIIAQATFADDSRTLGGESVYEVAAALGELPVAMLGTNCTLGPQGLLTVTEALARHAAVPVSAQPNAGLPRRVAGRRFEYNIDAAYLVRYARRFVDAGARLVGGCCGTSPSHIRAVVTEIATAEAQRRPQPQPAPASSAAAPAPVRALDDGVAARLASGGFVTAIGLTPPASDEVDRVTDRVAALRDRGYPLLFVGARPSARADPISLTLQLQHGGVEAIPTVTTWDKTIMSLQADLLGAHALGVRSVVCETGNPPLLGDYPNVDGVWDVDSVGLVELLADLNRGRDCTGLPLATKTSFTIGARFNPAADNLTAEIGRTHAKLQAGAQFLLTRPVHEPEVLRPALEVLSAEDVPVMLCVQPLRSFAEAEYLAHEVPDTYISAATLEEMQQAGADAERTGLRLAATLIDHARPLVSGLVLMLPEDGEAVDDYLQLAR